MSVGRALTLGGDAACTRQWRQTPNTQSLLTVQPIKCHLSGVNHAYLSGVNWLPQWAYLSGGYDGPTVHRFVPILHFHEPARTEGAAVEVSVEVEVSTCRLQLVQSSELLPLTLYLTQ